MSATNRLEPQARSPYEVFIGRDEDIILFLCVFGEISISMFKTFMLEFKKKSYIVLSDAIGLVVTWSCVPDPPSPGKLTGEIQTLSHFYSLDSSRYTLCDLPLHFQCSLVDLRVAAVKSTIVDLAAPCQVESFQFQVTAEIFYSSRRRILERKSRLSL